MKKGFTLVELLGIFSIMAAIFILAVPAITNLLKKATENEFYTFEENVFLSAEAYISNNKDSYPELRETNKKTYETIETLLNANYLNSTLMNPATKKKTSEETRNVIIVYMDQKGLYVYELISNVKDEETAAIKSYEALTSNPTASEKASVQAKIDALPNGSIKEALQNKIGE